MTDLSPDLKLHRAPNVRVDIDSSNSIQVHSDDSIFHLGPHGLALLDVFYQPLSVSEAIKKLDPMVSGPQDWISLTNMIVKLHNAGILLDDSDVTSREEKESGYGASAIHVAMLNDRPRTRLFLEGLEEVVKPGDVVLDIGTGTGILAMAAVRAGAERVYAVEASGIAGTAQKVFEANGMADRITLVRGWSTRIDLPERADVLVSEMIGNEPLGENVIEMTVDARKRLLKPNPRLVPDRVRVFGLPLTIPREELSERLLTPETLQNWQSWYSLDLGPLFDKHQDNMLPQFYIKPQKTADWETLSAPIPLADVNLGEVEQLIIDNPVTVTAETGGRLDGLLVYFDIDLGPSTTLSTHPKLAAEDNHWFSPVWSLVEPLELEAGDRFEVTYQYRASGSSHKVVVKPV